jgi:hypothetical protein
MWSAQFPWIKGGLDFLLHMISRSTTSLRARCSRATSTRWPYLTTTWLRWWSGAHNMNKPLPWWRVKILSNYLSVGLNYAQSFVYCRGQCVLSCWTMFAHLPLSVVCSLYCCPLVMHKKVGNLLVGEVITPTRSAHNQTTFLVSWDPKSNYQKKGHSFLPHRQSANVSNQSKCINNSKSSILPYRTKLQKGENPCECFLR